MTVNISNVDITVDTFGSWVTKVNQMTEAFRHQVATVSNTSLSTSTGNGAIIGRWTADTLVANVALRGGNNSSTNTLPISSNVVISNNLSIQDFLKISNSTVNVSIVVPTAAQKANTTTFLHANGSWTYIDLTNFPGNANTANSATYLSGYPIANVVTTTGDQTIANVKTFSGNLHLGAGLRANGSFGTAGFVLKTNGTTTYWDTASVTSATAGGSNTNIQFNDSSVIGGNNQFTWNKTTNVMAIGNSTVFFAANDQSFGLSNSTISATVSRIGLSVGNSTVNLVVNTAVMGYQNSTFSTYLANTGFLSIGNGTQQVTSNSTWVVVAANSTVYSKITNSEMIVVHPTQGYTQLIPGVMGIYDGTFTSVWTPQSFHIGNSTVNTTSNPTLVRVQNSSTSANLTSIGLVTGLSTVNATVMAVGSNVVLGATDLKIGNSTVNSIVNSSVITTPVISLSGNAFMNSTSLSMGNSSVNAFANSSTFRLNGVSIVPFGQQTIFVPAGAMTPRTSNGATANTYESTNNKLMVPALEFGATNTEFAQFYVHMPKSWNEGTLVCQFVWAQGNTVTNFGTVWAIEAVAFANNDNIDTAFGTAVQVTSTGAANGRVYFSPETSALTVAGSPAAEELVYFQVKRLPQDASDTMTVAAKLLGVKIHYTTDAATDD